MNEDWTKEFEKINIPYADDFVLNRRSKIRIEYANKTFDEFYKVSNKVNMTKVKFAEKVEIYYHENISTNN